jgi:hypothetical protein
MTRISDPLPGSRSDRANKIDRQGVSAPVQKRKSLIEFKSPGELRAWQEPTDFNLLSHRMLSRGDVTTLTGPPGTGKSRAALALAVTLAEGAGEWFHFKVTTPFRVMMIQDENGLSRLSNDMGSFPMTQDAEERLRISLQPDCAMLLEDAELVGDLCAAAAEHRPDLLIVDPWNSVTRDDTAAGFSGALKGLRMIASAAADANDGKRPAILVLHHPRKLRAEDGRKKGRDLSDMMAGSYQLFSKSRAGLFLAPASPDINEERVVLSITKASNYRRGKDEPMPGRSAWKMHPDGFAKIPDDDFPWDEYDGSGESGSKQPSITLSILREAFRGPDGERRWLPRKAAVEELMRLSGLTSDSIPYKCLETGPGSKFGSWLMVDERTKQLTFVGSMDGDI